MSAFFGVCPDGSTSQFLKCNQVADVIQMAMGQQNSSHVGWLQAEAPQQPLHQKQVADEAGVQEDGTTTIVFDEQMGTAHHMADGMEGNGNVPLPGHPQRLRRAAEEVQVAEHRKNGCPHRANTGLLLQMNEVVSSIEPDQIRLIIGDAR